MLENTKENKAKFFAQYYGQKVWRCELHNELISVDYEVLCHVDQSLMGAPIIKEWLELTPLSKITEQHLAELAEKTNVCIGRHKDDSFSSLQDFKNNLLTLNDIYLPSRVADILRYLGYLIDYNGTQTETLIEYGWAKLKN